MSVRINLLPDQKQAKVRAARSRQVAAAIATLVCSLSIGTVVVLLIITGAQKLRINGLNNDIESRQAELVSIEDLPEAVTAEQHLRSLVDLYDRRTALSKFFSLMESVAPVKEFGLSELTNQEGKIKMLGRARSVQLVDKFVKTLEASNLQVGLGAKKSNEPHFTNVIVHVLQATDDNKINFELTTDVSSSVTARSSK